MFLRLFICRFSLTDLFCIGFLFFHLCGEATSTETPEKSPPLPRVKIAADGRSFVLEGSEKRFVPWGFNYDHDRRGRLLEDYWEAEWDKVEEDFREMKQLGANVVRIHLQLGRFLDSPQRPHEASLKRLSRLLTLGERVGLYLDLTGLGCYHKKDVPAWYDALGEAERWAAQARFWQAVADCCKHSPAVFCYDLMNEPVVPGDRRPPGDWLGPPFDGKCFMQFITLTPGGRPRPAIARKWIQTLAATIRQRDRRHLITVGLVDWSLDRPGLSSGFVPRVIAGDLDFLSVHVYPQKGKIEEALKTLNGFAVGKPVLIEETFPLYCPPREFEQFLAGSEKTAAGWLGFYWGKTLEEYRQPHPTIADSIMRQWLEFFQERAKQVKEK
ncbi:MAG: cellulase family glycosylhydrolase [Pirellulales bacterium]|nr:cellulase family glycosylhydrolase [Pirellulales bacterium]